MQKNVVLALLIAALLAGSAFAGEFSMSTGAGLFFDFSGNNGVKDGGNYIGARNLSLGAHVFFDATYAEIDASFAYGKISGVVEGYDGIDKSAIDSRMWQFGLSLLGKYPFELGDFTVFPLLGLDYNMVLSHIRAGVAQTDPSKRSQLGFLVGAGADFDLTDSLYLRGEGMFHLRLPSTFWKDMASATGGSATLGMGPRMKIGVGYRF